MQAERQTDRQIDAHIRWSQYFAHPPGAKYILIDWLIDRSIDQLIEVNHVCVAIFLTEVRECFGFVCSYVWYHNGGILNMNAQNIRPRQDGTGSFDINPADSFTEGSYQCRAVTQYGTAVSNTSLLQLAVLQTGVSHVVRNVTAMAGRPFQIPVVGITCFPPAAYRWVIGRVVDNEQQHSTASRQVTTSTRVQISEKGN